jgi:hypothetical protein
VSKQTITMLTVRVMEPVPIELPRDCEPVLFIEAGRSSGSSFE